MRIAFVYDAVYPWEKGGAQKRVWELAKRLAEDHDVHLFGMHYWDGPEEIVREGVTMHGVCEPYDLYTDGRRSIPQALKFAGHVTPALQGEEFDIIDCQQFPYFTVLGTKLHELRHGSTLVVTWYEVWDDYWYDYLGWKGAFGKTVEQVVSRLPETIIPISSFIEDDLVDAGRTEGMEVVENGVDYHRLREIPETESDWDVVYFGRLAEHKRVEWLLEAIDVVRSRTDRTPETCIIGDGPERDRLERRASELGIDDTVTFEGFIEADDEVIANIKAADVFVLPSIREGFPNTILEANACGVPSIVVDHPENGSTAVVEDGVTGFVTDPDPAAIADRVVEVLTDQSVRAQLSEGARAYGEDHDWANIVDELEAVYRRATSETPPSQATTEPTNAH